MWVLPLSGRGDEILGQGTGSAIPQGTGKLGVSAPPQQCPPLPGPLTQLPIMAPQDKLRPEARPNKAVQIWGAKARAPAAPSEGTISCQPPSPAEKETEAQDVCEG